ncbi:DtxR family transcriptional regulator [Halobellus salinus]|uniref:DtxR family transcriptional regulator n=1 Tax=Halobellus salinus TaxID=931585 RepID=A0A830EII7_9EURY|nr:metal-dependent transcriptional regulator [Halobellus salinus]GGJ14975.1 DtxR family transcriptional regulator [Halobellus salinus]SMP32644.1 iron (metal) dependent repressor, DtxR family [Halobellus salinus]
MLSDVMEDYLKAIYRIQARSGPPVSTSAIADAIDKTPASVTSMLGTLEDRGVVVHQKYKGVELTTDGERVALEVVRHHRLLEAYLAEHLDYSWSEVHDEADALEHHISEEFERRVAAALDDPAVDPHGDPIPSADLAPLDGDDTTPLSACEVDDRVLVTRVNDRDREDLEYLEAAGVTPGTALKIVGVAPFGMVTVRVDGDTEQSLPESVAESIRVCDAVDAAVADERGEVTDA